MNKALLLAISVLMLTAAAAIPARGQFPEDVLRYSWQGTGPGGRSLAMGSSGMSFLADYTAVYWNPAGIGQAKTNEFSFGLSHLSYGNDATWMGTQKSFSNNQTSLDHLGLVYAVPTTRGHLSLGIGYDRSNDFTSALSFDGFNPGSGIVQAWAPDGQPYPDELTRAEALELARVDTISGTFISPIDDSLSQAARILEGGGLNRFSVSGAAELARDLYVGLSLNFLSGTYSYSSRLEEFDDLGLYQTFPFDYESLEVLDVIDADVSGFGVTAGMIARIAPNARFGLALRTPSWITVQETFTSDATSRFDDGSSRRDPADGDPGSFNEYDISTPWVFSAGLSGGTSILTLSGSVEYTDYTQMEFRNASTDLLAMNTDIKELYRPTYNIRLGGELRIPNTDFLVRAGYILLPSPYEGDPSSFDRKYVTGGVGMVIDDAIGIDVSYARGSWETFRWIYGDATTTVEEVTTDNLKGTLSYRF